MTAWTAYLTARRRAGWHGRRTAPHSRRYRGMAGVESHTGMVDAVTATGLQLDGCWYRWSRFVTFDVLPTRGARVEITCERFTIWVDGWRDAPEAPNHV